MRSEDTSLPILIRTDKASHPSASLHPRSHLTNLAFPSCVHLCYSDLPRFPSSMHQLLKNASRCVVLLGPPPAFPACTIHARESETPLFD